MDQEEVFMDEDEIEDVIDYDEENDEEVVDVIDQSVYRFEQHTSPVLCCDLSHDSSHAVTGGQDDKAFVWNVSTKQIAFEAKDHKESIVSARFNSNGKMVATGDMQGIVKVWDMTGQEVSQYELDAELIWMFWHPKTENVLFAGTANGEAWMWLVSLKAPQCKVFQSFGSENNCAKLFGDGKRIVMGYGDDSLRIWDIKDTRVIHTINGSNDQIISVSVKDDDSLVATGSVNSTCTIVNANTGKLVVSFKCGNDAFNSIESVHFTFNNTVTLGAVTGVIEVYDLSTCTKRSELKLDSGISRTVLGREHILYAACLDGCLRSIDLRACQALQTFTGHTDLLLDLCLAPDSKFVLTASDDKTARIFEV